MSADIRLHHAYGIRNDLSDILLFVDEARVVYPAGSNIVLHTLETNSQKFVPLNENGNVRIAIPGELENN